ncbi:hypothetical protein PPYR_09683 [Photinus pyralis]|uniref:Tryptophan--tRNA ligase, mitochondrial n=2 Tax=Photinus pyralis TaxID=7054 RepID=A0A1Y1LB20_PHOPY|nr:tryptophan--tRNA ligase, mitochondrial [Photinus pyralis]KAB0798690.1 hypothetical protein PPYR_09683 [Photinus pyralis]
MFFINRLPIVLTRKLKSIRMMSTKLKKSDPSFPTKYFSGIQPTGDIHLGNYLGAIKQWVDLQNKEDLILSVVDLHAITLPQDPKELYQNILRMTATLLACGVDTSKLILFQQSQVYQHTELAWIFSCICTMARLAHLPQFKEKSATLKDVPLGLYIYPVLQAADIMLYKATHVPVGDDQLQHLELSQDLARMFNRRYGLTFPSPHAIVTGTSKIKSLRNPSKKMSKSDPDAKSRICLTDSADEIARKIRKSVTDCTSAITFDPDERPGVSNLVMMHSSLSGKTVEVILKEVEGMDTLQYKSLVADCVISFISPISQRIKELMEEPQYLRNVLDVGTSRAMEIASCTMEEVRGKMGIQLLHTEAHELATSNRSMYKM